MAKQRLYDFFFYAIIGTLYSYALTYTAIAATVLQITAWELLAIVGACMLLFYIVFFNRYTFLVTLGALVIVGLVVYLLLWRRQFEVGWYRAVNSYINDILHFIIDIVPYKTRYDYPISIATAFLISLITALCIQVRFQFWPLLLLGAGVIAVPVVGDFTMEWVSQALFVLCVLVFVVKKMNLMALGRSPRPTRIKGEKRLPREQKRNAGFVLAAIPFCVLSLALSYLFPRTPLRLYDMPTPEILSGVIGEDSGSGGDLASFERYASGLAPQNAAISLDGETRLGGQLTPGSREIMQVDAPERVYLAGSIKDTYTGTSWTSSVTGTTEIQAAQGALENVSPYSQEQLTRHAAVSNAQRTLTVRTDEIRTKTLFAPTSRTGVQLADSYKITLYDSGAMGLDYSLVRGKEYTVQYYSMDEANELFLSELRYATGSDGVDESVYLNLPEALPQRVRNLAQEIAGGEETRYDQLKALERYLVQFPYTLNPESIPGSADFVDHFLFEGQAGYCTYYASSLAVMARALGIPTRYVEGYAMPPIKNAEGWYTVTNAQAHAWVEAWFPTMGWVTFEATAPYYYHYYEDETLPTAAEVFAPDMLEQNEETVEELGFDPLEPPGEPEPEEEASLPPIPQSQAESDAGTVPQPVYAELEPEQLQQLGVALLAAASFLFLLLVAGRRFLRTMRLGKIHALPNRESAIAYYREILRAAKGLGLELLPHETALAWAHRVGPRLPIEGGEAMLLEVAELFSKASYSMNDISPEEKSRMRLAYRKLWQCRREFRRQAFAAHWRQLLEGRRKRRA